MRATVDRPSSSGNVEAAARAGAVARILDTLFRVPGTRIRFGLDPLLGLVPGMGDVLGGIQSSYIIAEAVRSRASRPVLSRMLGNLVVDALLSAVPGVGDFFDVGWRANVRNLELLRRHLADPTEAEAASRVFIAALAVAIVSLVLGTALVAIWTVRLLFAWIGL